MADDILVKRLSDSADLNEVVRLQQQYWGDAMENIVPGHMLVNCVQYGGNVLGAYAGDSMIGASMAFLGTVIPIDDPHPAGDGLAMMSKRAVVLPEYRGAGVGEKLKRGQYQIAIEQGLELIRWTFDPALARNAYFNIRKLGAVIQKYERSYFGETAMHPTMLADRMVTNWWVKHPHTEAHLNNQVSKPDFGRLQSQMDTLILETAYQDGRICLPKAVPAPAGSQRILVPLPFDFEGLTADDTGLAGQWRDFLRAALETYLSAGYIVTSFIREGEHVFYMLTPDTGTFQFTQQS